MIQIIVFSYNRAMQLETLLSSLSNHWKSPDYKVDIVYNYSSKEFGDAYDKLAASNVCKNVIFHREDYTRPDKLRIKNYFYFYNIVRLLKDPKLRKPKTNFRSLVIHIIESSGSDDVMFLTDDSMFVNDVNIPQKDFDWINENPKNRQFSLRLGKGVSDLPPNVKEDGCYCSWNMFKNKGNWGYPFSVDAHIYNSNYLLKIIKSYLFYNPSFLEGNICSVVRRAKLFAEGRCFSEIKMLTFPINIVQNSVDNDSQDVSVEMLNQRYIEGEHLKYGVEKQYDPTKQYVTKLIFTDNQGRSTVLNINGNLVRPNAGKL